MSLKLAPNDVVRLIEVTGLCDIRKILRDFPLHRDNRKCQCERIRSVLPCNVKAIRTVNSDTRVGVDTLNLMQGIVGTGLVQ